MILVQQIEGTLYWAPENRNMAYKSQSTTMFNPVNQMLGSRCSAAKTTKTGPNLMAKERE
jgi:hypothetical protein